MNIIIQLIAGMIGSVGFAMMFGLKAKYILSAAIGGFLSWGLYLLGMHIFDNVFLACLMASAFCAFYSEITARIQKAPTTLFFITSVLPLIPGRTLYYTCSNAVVRNWKNMKVFANLTLQYALAIAAGACIVWAITITLDNIKKLKKSK